MVRFEMLNGKKIDGEVIHNQVKYANSNEVLHYEDGTVQLMVCWWDDSNGTGDAVDYFFTKAEFEKVQKVFDKSSKLNVSYIKNRKLKQLFNI